MFPQRLSNSNSTGRNVKKTWRRPHAPVCASRTPWLAETLEGRRLLAAVLAHTYTIVDTGQTICYGNTSPITAPAAGQAFYGQDAQHSGYQPSYARSTDGLTVYDNNTGLTWQHTPDTNGDGLITAADKLNWTNAQNRPAALNAIRYGGYSDWRLPTIKELYSLFDARGVDPSGSTSTDTSGLTPFIDRSYFDFAYGDTAAGERVIDSQYISSTLYVGSTYQIFGVNFADGRIKGYPYSLNGTGPDKAFLIQCVRGNTSYGINSFLSNGDSTLTDNATGLMWTQSDSGSGMTWQQALSWVQTKNGQNYLGHNDWRLPNLKELQSIVDYSRSPSSSNSAAISAAFNCTQITNEKGQTDYPWYWTSTTHAMATGSGEDADYIAFGRAWGYMNNTWVDIHGAGCQRSDPKGASLSSFSYADYGYYNSRAPQGDAIRISNYVRLVRDAAANTAPTDVALSASSVAENLPSSTAVGSFSSVDTDVGDTFTYTLVTGTGSTDNASFTIASGILKTAAAFNYEAKSSYSIRVRTTDAGGLFFEKSFTISITNVCETTIAGRKLFYNRSSFDGNNAAANASDDAAIATDKSALLPGHTATFANYSSYSRGLNGLMLDLGSFSGTLSASDFTFKVGNNNTPSGWAAAPAPTSITQRAIASGVTRVTLIWADNAIQKQWLQVTLLASVNSDLAANDVFYFGNAIAECGNSAANAAVNSTDEALVKNHQSGLSTVGITSVYDLNRDTRVNSSDLALARNNKSGLTPLVLITAPAGSGAAMVQSRPTVTATRSLLLADATPAATSLAPSWSQSLLFPDGVLVEGLLA